MEKTLTLLRGLPGSGKSTFANLITNEFSICEADKFFTDKEGNYNFDATKLSQAHSWCREQVEIRMKDNQMNEQFYPHIVVSNTEEVKEAIEKNGDFKVEFYRERVPNYLNTLTINSNTSRGFGGTLINNSGSGSYTTTNLVNGSNSTFTNTSGHIGTTALYNASVDLTNCAGSITLDSMDATLSMDAPKETKSLKRSFARSKSIETGRVEKGSYSEQKVVTVDKTFDYFAFHTIEYKMLPISQKINTVEDINVKIYCTNCGAKLGKGHKYCRFNA